MLVAQGMPGGVVERIDHDRSGEVTGLSYIANNSGGTAVPVLEWAITSNASGLITGLSSSADVDGDADEDFTREQSFTYDKAGRLTKTVDQAGGGCVVRGYGFDVRGNRLTTTSTPGVGATDSPCVTLGAVSTRTWGYDGGDRVTKGANNTGTYVYDGLGRQATIPATDTPAGAGGGSGDLSIAYFDTDAAKTLVQVGGTTTFTLDPAGRRLTQETVGVGASPKVTRHYTDASDNPGYLTIDGTPGATWYGAGVNGDLGVQVAAGVSTFHLIDPIGSVATTYTLPASGVIQLGAIGAYDEYGNPVTVAADPDAGDGDNPATTLAAGAPNTAGYGWLGGKQRATTSTGLVLMGARLYNPTTGTFTSVDPVPGGNTTTYAYPQDPINRVDLDGKASKPRKCGWLCKAAGFAAAKAVTIGCMAAMAQTLVGIGLARYACGALGGGIGGLTRYSWKYAGRGFTAKGAAMEFLLGGLTSVLQLPVGKYIGKYIVRWARGRGRVETVILFVNKYMLHGPKHAK